jgi:hypothetical protein
LALSFIVMQPAVMRFGIILTQTFTTDARHNSDMPEGTMRAIINQAGISVEEFLSIR